MTPDDLSCLSEERRELVAYAHKHGAYGGKEVTQPLLALIRDLAGWVEKAEAGSHHSVRAHRLAKAEKVVEAARGVGMNWKMGAPYGGDARDAALREYDGEGE